ncbi:MAG TPA: cytidylate kinase-like family protein [Candidatus Sulfotelmatobacter sp.]|jgi:cytidylate kinase
MFRLITIEREYGCGGGAIAAQLAQRLKWTLWDQRLTEEIAHLANVDPCEVQRCDERMDSRFYRFAKTFWRGSHERSSHLMDQAFDTDCMVSMMERISVDIAREGNAVVVGRGAPYFLRQQPDAFHVFLYAPRAEKIRRLLEDRNSESQAEELVDTVDRERMAYIKHYFNADWPTRSLYHMMLNTAMGNESVIDAILNTMNLAKAGPKATDYEEPKVPA